MPRYQIQSPDGRTVTIEGDRPPTQEDAARIFRDLPPKTEVTRRRALDINAPGRMDIERGLLRTPEGRQRLSEAEGQGVLAPRAVPGLLADIVMEGGGPAAGQALGAATGVPALIPVGGAVGGVAGNLASQQRRVLAGEQANIRPGEVISSAITGAIPGAPLAATGSRAILMEGLKQGLGGVIGKTAETMIDEGRLPSGTEVAITGAVPAVGGAAAQRIQSTNPSIVAAVEDAAKQGSGRRATLAAGQAEGLVIPPSTVNPSYLNRKLEATAGKEAVSQAASLKNQKTITQIAKRELGLPENAELTDSTLRSVREEASKPYGEIETMATKAQTELGDLLKKTNASGSHETEAARAIPENAEQIASLKVQAAADVAALRTARDTATKNFRRYRENKSPEALETAEAALNEARLLEDRIEVAAEQFGSPELLSQLREARTRIAKSWDVERAVNVGDFNVSAPALGRALDRGAPLTGGLETVARFQQAFPKSMREGATIPTPGVSKIQQGLMLLAGIGGVGATGSPYGALAGLAPLASDAARAVVVSDPYQRFATRIPLAVEGRPDTRALLARTLIQEGAQELAEETNKSNSK